jgi:hypothetical protein
MNLSDVLDGAFKLYKANFRTVVAVTAAFVVPLQLVAAFAQRNLLGGRGFMRVINDPSVAQSTADQRSNAQAVVALVATLLLLLVTPFVAGAISKVVAGSYLGAEIDAGTALRATGRRWWALTAAWILVHFIGLRWGWPLLALGSILTSLVTTPFVAIAATLLYFDGRIRNEGLDLQIMAAELARTPAA